MAPYATSTVSADGVNIFYRSSGPASAPVILLLHGFPSSSHQFRNLIPLLSQKYRVIAPDLPGYGFTEIPSSRDYKYTFANLATTVGAFLDVLAITKFSIYIFDYGAPTGLRLALQRPGAVQAIVTQNGNAYVEGLAGEFWDPIKTLWKSQAKDDREKLRNLLSLEVTKFQYTKGTSEANLSKIAPEAYTLDYHLMSSAANQEVQLDLFQDYGSNVPLYPKFQEWFKASKVPILAAWGKNDVIFIHEGAEAFKKDLGEQVELHLLDAGHFAVETETEELAGLILGFLGKNGI